MSKASASGLDPEAVHMGGSDGRRSNLTQASGRYSMRGPSGPTPSPTGALLVGQLPVLGRGPPWGSSMSPSCR
jgi:hypothetical protein